MKGYSNSEHIHTEDLLGEFTVVAVELGGFTVRSGNIFNAQLHSRSYGLGILYQQLGTLIREVILTVGEN